MIVIEIDASKKNIQCLQ